jgi:FHA domain-containing protein
MSVLRNIESKLESLFEGVFGRAFRTNVQPVELARKLVKEMDDHRNVSVSRVYVPNEYTVYLSAGDREQFSSYEQQLRDELADYLAEHARRESYVLLSPPRVEIETDEDLDVGVFGIATRMVQPNGKPADGPPTDAEPNATMVYKPSAAAPQPTEAASAVDLGIQREVAVLEWDGKRHEVAKRRVVIGRSKDADVQVADPNVSRRHAELRQEGATYWIVDLDSTNGVEVRGKRVKRLKLEDGTRFTIGSTEIAFSRELH